MAESQQSFTQFLTQEEALEVEKALLTSKEKFSTRLAIYALRVLKQIAQEKEVTVDKITPAQVRIWIENDPTIQQQMDLDTHFEKFFTQLVLSSMKPLKRVSEEADTPIEDLSVQQVVQWFEKENKLNQE